MSDDTGDDTARKMSQYGPGKPVAAAVDRFSGFAMSIIIDVLVVLVLAALGWKVWLIGVDLYLGIVGVKVYDVKNLFVEILTIFIFIEIFHSLVDYLRTQRISIVNLADVSLAIIFRELWIGLFGLTLSWQMVFAFAAVIVGIGAVRVVMAREHASLRPHSGRSSLLRPSQAAEKATSEEPQ
ncbi:MAG: phosphate-starvation-inducible PsiE family protein [Clostridiales bacterium]|nr:phosphate-starvation-inducible PsiE family protein [Clostridiales bacterium]